MSAPPKPDNEAERLAALYELLMLDTLEEVEFDKIVDAAAEYFAVPMASIGLLDEDRQWIKAAVGFGSIIEVPRDVSFCGHAILRREVMLVADTSLDVRFADNPFVLGAPFIRFVADAPIFLPSGYAVGSLCIMDVVPRRLDAADLAALLALRDRALALFITRQRPIRK
ncbi:GAF domain-containing protein [Pseudoduganella lurida]|uniref:GAF domain-containing protein n=1 Tax=Pseudoduganella lurida TaxID=1036180 RepID=UPI0011AA960B|nr:GAF domain-containing protein [Pseudoduganella lurida]